MRVKFYIFDTNNISANTQIEIQFKSIYNDIYHTQKIETVTEYDPRIYTAVFNFPQSHKFIYFSFRNAKTYQQSEQKTISISSFPPLIEEIPLFVEMKFETYYNGYTTHNGVHYATQSYGYQYRDSHNYLSNFIQPNSDCALYKQLLIYFGSLSFSFHMDKVSVLKSINTSIIQKALPNKIDKPEEYNVEEIFELLKMLDEDIKRQESYTICQTLSKVINQNIPLFAQEAKTLMSQMQRNFKMTDWLKELMGNPVTQYSQQQIIEVLYSKVKELRFDSEPQNIMDELIKIKQVNDNINLLKSEIIKKCYQEQASDILKVRFLFKYSSTLTNYITQHDIKEEFISLLNTRRQKYLHRDILKEIASNAGVFIRHFDPYGEMFYSHITKVIFDKDLYESEQISVLQALQENNLTIEFPWKKILLEAIRAHKSIEEVQKLVQIVCKANCYTNVIDILKKYYQDRIHYFYVSIFEKMQMKAILVDLITKQFNQQQYTPQPFEAEDSDDGEEEIFSELNFDSYHDEWNSGVFSGDFSGMDDKRRDNFYNNDKKSNYSTRGNRAIVYNEPTRYKVKKEPIFKEKKLTKEEIDQFEAFTTEHLHEVFRKFKSTELIKDAKNFTQKNEELVNDLLVLLQNHFGQYMKEEWNHFGNFKEKYEGLKKLAEENNYRKDIAQIVMRKYSQSAIEFYNSQKNKFPAHFFNKNLLDYMNEAFWLDETTEFRDLYLSEFTRFIEGHKEISISTLKTFLANKETPRIFSIVKQDFFPFKQKCSQVIEVFDKMMDQIGQLFKNYKDLFKKQQEVFSKEFNIEQKSGNIINLIGKFEDINLFTEFNYNLRESDIYQSIKRFILLCGTFKNEYEVFASLKYNLEYFVRFILQNKDITFDGLQRFNFEEIAEQLKLVEILRNIQSKQRLESQQEQPPNNGQMEQEQQNIQHPPQQQENNENQQNQQNEQAPNPNNNAPVQQPVNQEQQQANDQNEANQMHIEQDNQQQQQQPQQGEQQPPQQLQQQQQPQDQQQQPNQQQQEEQKEEEEEEEEQPKILITMDWTETFSIIDLKNHTGSTYEKSTDNISQLLQLLGIEYNRNQLEVKLFNIYSMDFFKKYNEELLSIYTQYGIDINHPLNAKMKQQFELFQNIQNFNKVSIWELDIPQFQDLFDCFKPVTLFDPRLVELLRRCEDIIFFAYENFTGVEGRGFLDLNDIIDDQDADISSLIIKLNQLTPFINQLVKIRKNNVENPDQQDAKQTLIELFETISKFLLKEDDQINLEDSVNNFFKIKNMQLNFDKKKSYILLSQQIVKEGKMKIYYDQEQQQSISIQVLLEDKIYLEDEINQICSKVIIEQNTTNIIINQARRAIAQKTKKPTQGKSSQNSTDKVDGEEEEIPDQKPEAIEEEQENNDDNKSEEKNQQEEETLLMESAAIKQKIEQFKEMWTKIGDLKNIMNEINLLGYFDIHQMSLEYDNDNNQIENNFDKINSDKRTLQALLFSWKEQIRECCKQYPLFSFLGHNLYSQMLLLIDHQKKFEQISSDLKDLLELDIFSYQLQQHNSRSQKIKDNEEHALEIETDHSKTQSSQEKLQKISSWFAESRVRRHSVGNIEEETEEAAVKEERVQAIIYSGNKELVDVIFKIIDKQNKEHLEPLQFYQYIYCDQLTQIQDLDLFINRILYFIQDQPKLYILVLNNKLEAAFTLRAIESIQKINKSKKTLFNKLIVLGRREIYSELISNVSQISVEDFLLEFKLEKAESKQQEETATTMATEENSYKTTFFTSLSPGAGKSFQIQKIFSTLDNKRNNVRIAINGTGSKKDLINLFRERLSSCEKNKPIHIHVDIYPYDQYDLNMLLFEIIAFRSLSIHQKSFINIGSEASFYIEINNTLKNDLQESIFIKEHFKNVLVKFNIDDYNPIVDIIGYKNYSYAAIVNHYLQNILFGETEKNVFDIYQPLGQQQDQQNQGEEEQGEQEAPAEQNEGQQQEAEAEEEDDDEGEEEDNDDEDDEDEEQVAEVQNIAENAEEQVVENEQEQQNIPQNQQGEQSQVQGHQQIQNEVEDIPIQQEEESKEQREEAQIEVEQEIQQLQHVETQANKVNSPLRSQSAEQQQVSQNIHPPQSSPNVVPHFSQSANISQQNSVQSNQHQDNVNIQSQQISSQNQQEQLVEAARQESRQIEIEEEHVSQQQQEVQVQNIEQHQEDVAQQQPVQIQPEASPRIPNQEAHIEPEQNLAEEPAEVEEHQNEEEHQEQQQPEEPVEQQQVPNQMEENLGDFQDFQDESFFDYTIFEKVEYKVENLDFFQELLRKQFVDKLIAQNIEPCFHQLTNFINLFGSEMQKFEKCFFLEKHILYELEPQLLQQGLRSKVVELQLQLCFLVSTNQQRPLNVNIDPQNRNRREYILNEKAMKIQRFSELMTSFVTFQEQDNPCLTSFFPTSNQVPRSISNLYSIQGHTNDLIFFDQNIPQPKLLKWLNMLINKHGDTISEEVQDKVKRLAIQRDNFFKIAMIFMRIRALSPIVLMGEAGTGKTALIELLSALMDAKFYTMNIHAGVTESEVISYIYTAINSIDKENQKVIVFFDEMNTNKLVEGIFKEIIVDRCIKGSKLPECFIPITAINPYKLKSKEQKQMFNLQVHGGIKREVMSKMNNTDLEYMVEPLPESLYSFIWNIDHLSNDEEDQYIIKIVQYKNQEKEQNNKPYFNNDQFRRIINSLSQSQKYLRKIMGCQSACSLRDIARFTKLLFWFQSLLTKCTSLGLKLFSLQECAITLALYVNYCVRIPLQQQRKDYIKFIYSGENAKEDAEAAQTFLSNQIEVPKGIVKNTAFKQNTLTLFASIMNKIPVILIGQPGCTKTLSLRLLIQSLRGDQSKSELFKSLKTLVPIYYQGHVQSTSDRIMEVFTNANKKQQKIEADNQQKRYLSLVYLEEIGLAEISPHNPLKVLHQTLEKPKVAVACISNWPLDQSKMNRMLSVYRLDTSKDELIETVQCIYEELATYEKDDYLKDALLKINLQAQFAKWSVKVYTGYNKFLKKKLPEHEQFHGLRDFYGMAKLFCSKYIDYVFEEIFKQVDKNNTIVLESIDITDLVDINPSCVKKLIIDSFLRHFSGLREAYKFLEESIIIALKETPKTKELQPNKQVSEQEKELNLQREQSSQQEQQQQEQQQQQQQQEEQQEEMQQEQEQEQRVEEEEILLEKVMKKESSWMEVEKDEKGQEEEEENLDIEINEIKMIDENLSEKSKYFLSRNLMIISQNTQKALEYITSKISSTNQPVKVFLGSDFPEDKKSETSYQIINEIISCIESGVFVVLQNLDNVYQSLYELLNQNYHYYNGKYFCRVSLGADTSNVEVSTNFKIILIANHNQIPHLSGPLLNRFEKHIFEQSMILNEEDQQKIQAIETHFLEKDSDQSNIFNCSNTSQVIESVYLQQKNLQDDESTEQEQTRSILQKLYHMAPFMRVFFYSKDEMMLSTYINSCLHFSLNDFIENKIIRQQITAETEVQQFVVFSLSAFSNTAIKMQYEQANLAVSVIHLAEITSQMNLADKLKDFFSGTKEVINNEGNIIEGMDVLQVEEGRSQLRRRRSTVDITAHGNFNSLSENSNLKTQPILFVVCDMEEDSVERIIFTKQKITEYTQSYSTSKDKIVVLTIKVTSNFQMIPVSNNWEHYFIDELVPLQNVNCQEMKNQMNLQHLLQSKNVPFLDYFRVEPLLQSFLKSSENISISYRKVRYQQDVMNYKTNRLNQLKTIFLNLNHSEKLNKLNIILMQILQIKFSYCLHQLNIISIEDFVQKQVFSKGFIYQSSSILKAIVSGIEDLMQQSLCFFIELLEKQQILFSLSNLKEQDHELFSILVNRILKSLDLKADENSYIIEQFEQQKSQIDSYPNAKFITRGVQLISVSNDLLFPLEQAKILSPLIQIIQKQIYSTEKQNLLDTAEQIIHQLQDLFTQQDIQTMIKFDEFFTQDYLLTRLPEFKQTHFKVLLEILRQSYNLQELDKLQRLLIPILGFEKYHKQIIKAQSFIEVFETELSFVFKVDQFSTFITNNTNPEERAKKDDIVLFNFFVIGEIFQFLYENISIILRKNQIQSHFTKLLKYIDSQDMIQYRFSVLDRIIQISKMIIQFSQEIFDNNQRNYDILKEINFDEIRNLNFQYIQQLKEQICTKLILDQDEHDSNYIYNAYNLSLLLESDKSGEKKEQALKSLENQILQKQEKKLVQFEKSWSKFITGVILSNVNEISIENEPVNSKLLKFIVDLEISMTSLKSENIQQIFNVIVSEAFGHVKIEQLKQFYSNETENPCLVNENYDNPIYHTEHFSLVILSQIFQENIIRPAMQTQQGSCLVDIVLYEQFEQLQVVQKIIYFSIFREVIHQIFKNNFQNLALIYPPEESQKVLNLITNYIKKLKSKPFQLYILKQLYQLCKSDMSSIISQSPFFTADWITDFTLSFKRLEETEFLKPLEKDTFKKYFDSYTPLTRSIKDLIYGEIRFAKNGFRDIYDGKLESKFYPFMMYNNIQILFDRDPKNNNQLYQCSKCQEYIFSDQCPDLQSKHRCLQCGSVIALNNQNTKRVLQNACQNIAELHKIINEDQWRGYYLLLQEDKPDFKLNEGSSFDLRVMGLMYNTVFLLGKTKNYRYLFESKETLIDANNNVLEVTISELNKSLRIHYQANAEEHLNYQIEISIQHIKDYLIKLHKAKDEDIPIILFKFIYNMVGENEVKCCDTVQERVQQNVKLSEVTKAIYEEYSRLSQVEQSFSKKILEQQESLNLQNNYKRNLRYFDTEYKLESLNIQLNEQIPNNEFQVLKKLLNFKEVNQISRILKVFVKFYKYMNREFSNKYSLTKAQDISFAKAFKNNQDSPIYQYYITEFLPAWGELRERVKHFQIECEQIEIPQFDENTKLNFLVFGDQKNLGQFSNGIELLCQLQNNYIHHVYQLSVIDTNENKIDSKITQQVKNLFENSEDTKNLKSKPLDQINPSIHLLKSYDEMIIKNYVFSNLEYGNGKKYIFDLEQLQQRLVKDVLTGAVLIDLERTVKFKYLNEVHQIGLLSNNLIPQETIFFEIRSKIQKFFTNKEQAFEFLQQLSTIFQMFKAESLQGELSIKSALDILQLKLKQENMKEILSEQLKLKHLNDLICCIEEIQLDNLVELCNPFYKLQIQPEVAQRVAEFIKLYEINIDDFLVALGRFTIRCLSSDASSISPQANLFEQIFYTDIYSELWRDPSKLDKIYKEAVEIQTLIGQSYSLYQFISKLKSTQELSTHNVVKEENIPNIIL